MFPYSLTGNSVFPFIIVCPTNANCFTAPTVRLTCCSQEIQVVIPTDATQAERTALVQALLNQCQQLVNHCTTPTNPNNPDDPSGDPTFPTTWYYSNSRWAEVECSDTYGGGTYRYTLGSGEYVASSQVGADYLAAQEALRLARLHKFCLNAPCLCTCADVAVTLNISTVGGTGPFTFSITSGTLPTGLTMSVVGGVLRVTGTPTTAGSSTITVKVNDSVGGYLIKTMTFYILEITTASPLPEFTTDVAYSQQLAATGGTGSPNYSFSLVSGSLPTGLSLSTSGLISGTPTGTDDATFVVGLTDVGLTQADACEKEFTIEHHVEPASQIIYWRLNTAGPAAIDVGGNGRNSNFNFGTRTVVAGKFTDAWRWNAAGQTTLDGSEASTGISLTRTVRFWIRANVADIGSGNGNMMALASSGLFSWRVLGTTLPSANYRSFLTNPFDLIFPSDPIFAGPAGGFGGVPSPGYDWWSDQQWHRIVVTFDESTGGFTYRIDDQLTVSGTTTLDPVNNHGFSMDLGNSTNMFDVCDVYIASNYIWSEADATYDWNGGTGRTYPDVPGMP